MTTYRLDTLRVDTNQHAETPKRRVLFLIILNLPQRSAPRLPKALELRRNQCRRHEAHPASRHCRVLGQTLGRLGVEQDRHEAREQRLDKGIKRSRVTLELEGNLASGPCGIVADRHAVDGGFRDDLFNHGGHDLRDKGFEQGPAGDGEVAEEGVRGLADGGFVVL